jgi:hypothetical protein
MSSYAFPEWVSAPLELVFFGPLFLMKKKKKPVTDWTDQSVLPFVILKPQVRGRNKRREEWKDGGGGEAQLKWWWHF